MLGIKLGESRARQVRPVISLKTALGLHCCSHCFLFQRRLISQEHGFSKKLVKPQVFPVAEMSVNWDFVLEMPAREASIEMQRSAYRVLLGPRI